MKYDIAKEYVNIKNYSPFCFINEVSSQYQFSPFLLPFIEYGGEVTPVHPDTFFDLKLDPARIVFEKLVYPTSSFRTVFVYDDDLFLKLPLLRKITRGVRDLSRKQLERSELAGKLLGLHPRPDFSFLPEICHYADDDNFNFIERAIANPQIFPWFYAIASRAFGKEFLVNAVKNIISTWMFFASNDLLLEYHTQNILVDAFGKIYYRDLSDVKSFGDNILRPSYFDLLECKGDLFSLIFDRGVCLQNLDHIVNYGHFGGNEIAEIKDFINLSAENFGISFPNHSVDFLRDVPERRPQAIDLVSWRQ